MLHTINCAEGEHHYVCKDDHKNAKGVLFMHTQDSVDYQAAEKFCNDRGASIPNAVNEGSCMLQLSTQLQSTYPDSELLFWATDPGFSPYSYNGHSSSRVEKEHVACFDKRICLRPTDPAYGSYSNGVFSQQEFLNTLTLTCKPGYEVQGNPKVTCITAPSTTSPLATCAKICTKPTVTNGAFRNGSFNTINNQLEGTCDYGYHSTQVLNATCNRFGQVTVVGECSALWTTVRHHDKYYLSTFNNRQWVQYDVASRACAFYGQRLLSESDMPESVLKSLHLRPGAYFLDGGKKIVTQNYEEGSNRVILQIFNIYPGTTKQILCIQICNHGQLVKGRCICKYRYIGETCEKEIRPAFISVCAATEESPKLRFPLMGSAATFYQAVSSLQDAQHLCLERGFGVLDFGDISSGTGNEKICKLSRIINILGFLSFNYRQGATASHPSSISFWSAYSPKIYAMSGIKGPTEQSSVLMPYESGQKYSVACEGHWRRKTVQSGIFSLATLAKNAAISYEFAGDACAYINHRLLTLQEFSAAFEYDATLRANLDDLLVPGVGPDYILAGGRVKAHYSKVRGSSHVVFLATDGAERYSVLCGRGNFAALGPAH
ncbi:uncharacterized protein LOC135828510 [Sycon ciliatum]|uniref:uncharacterized protein LOC135828510 n=1 Tax=Sycon ciliatum TaxID=27933 RepID=UPI0031F65A5C